MIKDGEFKFIHLQAGNDMNILSTVRGFFNTYQKLTNIRALRKELSQNFMAPLSGIFKNYWISCHLVIANEEPIFKKCVNYQMENFERFFCSLFLERLLEQMWFILSDSEVRLNKSKETPVRMFNYTTTRLYILSLKIHLFQRKSF